MDPLSPHPARSGLRPQLCVFDCANGDKPIQFGLVAEEVAEVFPELVVFNKDGTPETVKYQLLEPLLLNELQKEHGQLAVQEKLIHDQAEQLTAAQAMIREENEKLVVMQNKVSEVEALKARLADLERVTALLAKMNGGEDGVSVQKVSRVVDSSQAAVAAR
jgi:hypothetical protein